MFNTYPACVGDTGSGELDGFALVARYEYDPYHGAPWEEEDGHGHVSPWTRRAKSAGELVLSEDRGSYRYYDFAAAVQRAERAARADYERLRRGCKWCHVGVIVTAYRKGIELGSASLWGIESDAEDYLQGVCRDLAHEAVADARAALVNLCECGGETE